MTEWLTSEEVPTYPPGGWSPRPPPRTEEIDDALNWARDWWWYGAGNNSDESLQSFIDLFERYLAGAVRRRMNRERHSGESTVEQATLGGDQA